MPQPTRSARLLVRRAVLLAGAAGVVALQSAAPATALIQPPRAQTAVTASTARPTVTASTRGSSVTVTGPHMYDPKTKSPFPNASTVTVNQTKDLVNQTIRVSWTNFTPSAGSKTYVPSIT